MATCSNDTDKVQKQYTTQQDSTQTNLHKGCCLYTKKWDRLIIQLPCQYIPLPGFWLPSLHQ